MILGDIGVPLKIPLVLEKGETDRYPLASLYGFDGSLLETFGLEHIANGFYLSPEWIPEIEGYFFCTVEVYLDEEHTEKDTSYGQTGDTVKVGESSNTRACLGVTYNSETDTCYVEMWVECNGRRIASDISDAEAVFYLTDDSPLFTVTDEEPDGEGVFRMTKEAPGFAVDRLYSVKCSIMTLAGIVITTHAIAAVD